VIATVQRVSEAKVEINNSIYSEIGEGVLILLCVESDDDSEQAIKMSDKIFNFCILEGDKGIMSASLRELEEDVMIISQFTLAAITNKGNKPSFHKAAKPNKAKVREKIINPIIPTEWIKEDTKIYINPTGKFVIGGPVGDCGLTGRKIIVDTYGGMARHGGGAFSGKDPSKVDRSAAYACRYVAKNIVAAGHAERCEVQVSYAIGIAEPTSITVDTLGTGNLSENEISQIVRDNFDLRPKNLINLLDLKRPIYKNTASYGHFGRENKDFSWENTDISGQIK